MKKLYSLLLIISITTSAFAQKFNECSQLGYEYNGTSYDPASEKYTYQYNQGNAVEQISYNWNGSDWEFSGKTENEFNSNGDKTKIVRYNWDGSSWAENDSTFFTHQYDAENKLFSTVESFFMMGDWITSDSTSYHYSGDQLMEDIDYTFDPMSSEWQSDWRTTYSYNNNGEVSEAVYYTWNGASWARETSESYSYQYNSEGKVTEQIISSSSGEITFKYEYDYSGCNVPLSTVYTNNTNSIDIYPNPAQEKLIITTEENAEIILFNTMGIKFHQQTVTQKKTEIDLSDYPQGMYLLKFNSNGRQSVAEFVKK